MLSTLPLFPLERVLFFVSTSTVNSSAGSDTGGEGAETGNSGSSGGGEGGGERGGEGGSAAAALRLTCRWLRDAFDACNLRLALAKQVPGSRSRYSHLHSQFVRLSLAGEGEPEWDEPPGLRSALLALIRRSPRVTYLSMYPQLTWLSLGEVLHAGGEPMRRRLTDLFLMGRDDVDDLRPIAPLGALERLNAGFTRVACLAPLAACVRLTHLDLRECGEVRDLGPLAQLPCLRELVLYRCTKLHSLEPLAHCRALEVLDVSHCTRVGSLAPLAACTKLAWLDVTGCRPELSVAPLRHLTKLVVCRVATYIGMFYT